MTGTRGSGRASNWEGVTRALLVASLVLLPRGTAAAQDPVAEVRGAILDNAGAPLPFANVVMSALGRSLLADAAGRFTVRGLAAGEHELRVRQIGFAPVRLMVHARPPGAGTVDTIRLVRLPLLLDRVVVVSDPTCTTSGFDAAQGGDVGALLELARENAELYRRLATEYPVQYRLARVQRYLDARGAIAGEHVDTLVQRSDERTPYAPGQVLVTHSKRLEVQVPSLADVAEPAFQSAHCFRYAGTDTVAGRTVHRVDFMPTARVRTTDVSGSLYLDAATGLLRRGAFRLVQLPRRGIFMTAFEVTTTYREVQPFLLVPAHVTLAHALRNVNFGGKSVARHVEERTLIDHQRVGTNGGGPDHP